MATRNYDPGKVVLSFRGLPVVGYADSFIEAQRSESTFSTRAGAGGDVTRIRNRNKSGVIQVTLIADSPSNDDFSTILLEDEEFGTGTGEVQLVELNGTTLLQGDEAWLEGPPTVGYSKEGPTRTWSIGVAELEMFVGGLDV